MNLVSARQRKAGVLHSHSHCAFRGLGRIISWSRQVVHVCSRSHTEFTLFVNQLCPDRPTESAASSHGVHAFCELAPLRGRIWERGTTCETPPARRVHTEFTLLVNQLVLSWLAGDSRNKVLVLTKTHASATHAFPGLPGQGSGRRAGSPSSARSLSIVVGAPKNENSRPRRAPQLGCASLLKKTRTARAARRRNACKPGLVRVRILPARE